MPVSLARGKLIDGMRENIANLEMIWKLRQLLDNWNNNQATRIGASFFGIPGV